MTFLKLKKQKPSGYIYTMVKQTSEYMEEENRDSSLEQTLYQSTKST